MKVTPALALVAISCLFCLISHPAIAQQTTLTVGSLTLVVTEVKGTVESQSVSAADRVTGTLTFETRKGKYEVKADTLSLTELRDKINKEVPTVTAHVAAGTQDQQLVVQTNGENQGSDLSVQAALSMAQKGVNVLVSQASTPDFLISLDPQAHDYEDLPKVGTKVLVQLPDGTYRRLSREERR